MKSSYKFIQKFWVLSEQIVELCKNNSENYNDELNIFTNQAINKINQALEKFRYNLIIATFHEIYSYFKKIIESKNDFKNLKNNFEKIILIMMPVMPHLANECLEKLNNNNFEDIKWPNVEEKYLLKETNDIVIQVNGKKRGIISAEKNITENDIIDEIKNKQLIDKYLISGKLIKTIYVKDRLINYIIK